MGDFTGQLDKGEQKLLHRRDCNYSKIESSKHLLSRHNAAGNIESRGPRSCATFLAFLLTSDIVMKSIVYSNYKDIREDEQPVVGKDYSQIPK